jgi:hypothetical protein
MLLRLRVECCCADSFPRPSVVQCCHTASSHHLFLSSPSPFSFPQTPLALGQGV